MNRNLATEISIILILILFAGCDGGMGENGKDNQEDDEIAFFEEPNPEKIIVDEDGSEYPVNQILLQLTEDSSRNDAEEIAELVQGVIVGFIPSVNIYQINVPFSTPESLEDLITNLEGLGDSRIQIILRNYLINTSTVPSDTRVLKENQNLGLTDAYDRIKVLEAWEIIGNRNTSHVTIGIIDTGVYANHQEFNQPIVNFGSSNTNDLIDSDISEPQPGHGTQIAGIIGANNRVAKSFEWRPPNEMNGIISGIPGIDYTLEVRARGRLAIVSLWAHIQNLSSFAQVINISQDSPKCSIFTFTNRSSCVPGAPFPFSPFDSIEIITREIIESAPETIFVVAAGNDDINVAEVTPAGISLPNIITVGATTLPSNPLFDDRKSNSNWGSEVDIAAPGDGIFAPRPPGPNDPTEANNLYDSEFGDTSGATAMVTGVIAMLLAINPNLTPQEIKNIIHETGDPIITDKPISGKRLNAFRAVGKVLSELVPQPIPPPSPSPFPPPSPSPAPTTEICDDGIDNDQDGNVDCLDAECSLNTACNEVCDDGVDNDQDGLVDCADTVECSLNPACNEICDDGIDNNFNGEIDCADPACFFDPAC